MSAQEHPPLLPLVAAGSTTVVAHSVTCGALQSEETSAEIVDEALAAPRAAGERLQNGVEGLNQDWAHAEPGV